MVTGRNFAAMDAAAVGAIIGGVIGLAGALIGTYFAVKQTNGPRERRFMRRASLAAWLVLLVFAAVMIFVPSVRTWGWMPACALVVFGVPLVNRRQQYIRQYEEQFSPMHSIFF